MISRFSGPTLISTPPIASTQNFLASSSVRHVQVVMTVDDRAILGGEQLRRCIRRWREDEKSEPE